MERVEYTLGGSCRLSPHGVFREQLSGLDGMGSGRGEGQSRGQKVRQVAPEPECWTLSVDTEEPSGV